MRFYLILFFCVSLFFTSCKENKNIPADVIPEHEMAELLTDIHIVDGSLYDVPQTPDTLAKHGLVLYVSVFRQHHVDTALFVKSIKFYSTRPDIMNEIYTGITRRLQRKIDSLQKHPPKLNADSVKKVAAKNKTDSLKRIKEKAKLDSIQRANMKHAVDSVKKLRSPMMVAPQKKLKLHKVIRAHVIPAS